MGLLQINDGNLMNSAGNLKKTLPLWVGPFAVGGISAALSINQYVFGSEVGLLVIVPVSVGLMISIWSW